MIQRLRARLTDNTALENHSDYVKLPPKKNLVSCIAFRRFSSKPISKQRAGYRELMAKVSGVLHTVELLLIVPLFWEGDGDVTPDRRVSL